jgi:pimeloyl-ACP methyl ester carboxylesterase
MEFPIKKIQANGIDIAYLEVGTGPLVVLLHGFPDSARTWGKTMSDLDNAGFRAVAVFLRGYYPSEIPSDGNYSVEAAALDVIDLIKKLGETEAIIVGHDWGASVAYAISNINPQITKKIIALAIPHPKLIKITPSLFIKSPHFFLFQFGFLSEWFSRLNNFAYIEYLYHNWSPSWNVPAVQISEVKKDFSRPRRLRAAIQYYHYLTLDYLTSRKQELYRKKINVPTLCIVGKQDRALGLGLFENTDTAFSGTFKLEIFNKSGHFPHQEEPELFIQKLLGFIKV